MNTISRLRYNRTGSAFITVMIVLLIIGMYLGTIITGAMREAYSVKRMANRMRAQAIAEGGVAYAYSVLVTNWEARSDPSAFPLTSYSGGTYDLTTKMATSNIVVITSTGTYQHCLGLAIADVRNTGTNGTGGGSTPSGAYSNVILAGGTMDFAGSGNFVVNNGIIHGNSTFVKSGSGGFTGSRIEFCGGTSLSGSWTIGVTNFLCGGDMSVSGSGKILGRAACDRLTCSGSFKIMSPGNTTCLTYKKTGSGGVMGTLTTNTPCTVPAVPIPDIDLTPYYNEALKNGEVYSSSVSRSGSAPIEPVGGIMWVNGDLNISGSGNMKGCFIATGNIGISGSGNHTNVYGYPGLVSRDGNLDISGSGTYRGLLYSRIGTFSKSGSGMVTGSIICGGNFTASGSWNTLCYMNSFPTPPASGGSSPGTVVLDVSAWSK